MKLGLDYHGILDKHTALFAELTKALYDQGWEVHIITGQHIDDTFLYQLISMGIHYTCTFSIIDYHESIGTDIQYDERGPWIDEVLWNETKAEYCRVNGIDLHIDDSSAYGDYFTTPYLQMKKLAVVQPEQPVEEEMVDLQDLSQGF